MHAAHRRLAASRRFWPGLLLAIPIATLIYVVGDSWWLAGTGAGLLVLARHRARERRGLAETAFVGLSVGVVIGVGWQLALATAANVVDPPQWDFRAFWLHARVAALGLNFYEPEHARALAAAFQNTPDFLPELDFFYPPPTMFLFGPLGYFEIEVAALLWAGLQSVALILGIWLLWQTFFRDEALPGLLAAAALVLLLRSTASTVHFEQTNFLVLLFVLLGWRARSKARSGLWFALGVYVKPLVVLIASYLVLRRAGSGVVTALLTGLGLLLASAAVFGVDTIGTYLTANPSRAVDFMFTHPLINQSLIATLLRAFPVEDGHSIALVAFGLGAVVIVGVTVVACVSRTLVSDELALSILIPAALMLSPSSLAHYSVLLVVPIAHLVTRREAIPGGILTVVAIVVPTFLFAGSRFSFVAAALVWTVMVGLAGASIVRAHWSRRLRGEGDVAIG